MRITWFSWKDIWHPETGGAEQIADIILSGLARDGHQVTLVTARYPGSTEKDVAPGGYTIVRSGSTYSVYVRAVWAVLSGKYSDTDLFVDEASGIPFFTALVEYKKPVVTIVYHVQRKIWFYQMPFPLNILGYFLEPIWIFLLGIRSELFLTISESTKKELLSFGVPEERLKLVPISIEIPVIPSLAMRNEETMPTILAIGGLRPMKKALLVIAAFEEVYKKIPEANLVIAGGGSASPYGKKVLSAISRSPAKEQIRYVGKITKAEKVVWLRKAWVLIITSVKEGWGLVATEAHSQGLPTVAANVPGLRDSTKNGISGMVVPDTADDIARATIQFLENLPLRHEYSVNAWEDAKQYVPEKTYVAFLQALKDRNLLL
jgi:glycosyltransferase involved in cell wall biosynthesis